MEEGGTLMTSALQNCPKSCFQRETTLVQVSYHRDAESTILHQTQENRDRPQCLHVPCKNPLASSLPYSHSLGKGDRGHLVGKEDRLDGLSSGSFPLSKPHSQINNSMHQIKLRRVRFAAGRGPTLEALSIFSWLIYVPQQL